MQDVVYMKYTFRPVAGKDDHLYCRQLKVTVECTGAFPKTSDPCWCAWRNGVKGEREYYSNAAGAQKRFTTARACVESVVQSDWLVGTDE